MNLIKQDFLNMYNIFLNLIKVCEWEDYDLLAMK